MDRRVIIGVLILWLALGGWTISAQERPDLVVTLHDVANTPLVGVNVSIRDTSGTRDLARAATDAQGVAIFAKLTERAVRVAVAGALPGGARLYQPGNDAAGVSVWLEGAPTQLDLRSAADGMVAPDPATMTALEPGVPVATVVIAFPTAPIASAVSVVQEVAPTAAVPVAVDTPNVPMEPPAISGVTWLGFVALALLLVAGIGIVLVQRRAV